MPYAKQETHHGKRSSERNLSTYIKRKIRIGTTVAAESLRVGPVHLSQLPRSCPHGLCSSSCSSLGAQLTRNSFQTAAPSYHLQTQLSCRIAATKLPLADPRQRAVALPVAMAPKAVR